MLHSLLETKMIFNTKEKTEYFPEFTKSSFFCKLSWSNEEINEFNKLTQNNISRFEKFKGKPREAKHLLKAVIDYEEKLKKTW